MEPTDNLLELDLVGLDRFKDLSRDLSQAAKAVLAAAKEDGYGLSRRKDEPIVVLRRKGEPDWEFQSNDEIMRFGRACGYAN